MGRICYVISAGDCTGINIIKKEEDCIIVADGGYSYAKKYNIKPDYIIGDFDSLGYIPKEENTLVCEPEKDYTDTFICVKFGEEKGYTEFVIYGALGGDRMEHTIANMQMLNYLSKKGLKGTIVDKNMKITSITNDKITLPKQFSGYFSVFAFDGDAKDVTIKNAKYELSDFELKSSIPIGVSNEFVGEAPEISVGEGTLLLVWYEG